MTEKLPSNGNEEKPQTGSVFTLDQFSSKANLTEKGIIYDDDYNPFDHRDPNGNTTMGSLAHLLKSSLGSGILAMPMAFKNAGLLFGGIGTIVVGFLCTHCVHILVKTSHEICKEVKKPALGFAETAEAVFANGPKGVRKMSTFAKNFVDGSLMATYWAAACVYVVFIATSFHDVINYDLGIDWDKRIYIAMITIFIVLVGQIRNLKILVPFSATANVFIVVTFAITLYYMFREPLDFSDKSLFAGYKTLPMFFATVIFAMEGIGVVMPVENEMRSPQRFLGCPGVLNTAMITVIVLYAVIGFFGFVKYGDEVLGSITLNLPDGAILADTAKILMALAIFCTYPLQLYVPNDILWKKINHLFPESRHNIAQILLRALICLITCGVAAGVPDLEPFIGLVGSVFFSILGIFVPSFVETVYKWDNLGRFNWILIKNVFLMICAVLALLTGAFVSLEEIITGSS